MRAIALVLLALLLHSASARAEVSTAARAASGFEPWSSDGALTVPKGRSELALFGLARYGLTRDIELALQPVAFFVAPHLEAKIRVYECGPWTLALKPRLSYPTPFLNLVSREGSGGLLPATTDVPQALMLEADVIASLSVKKAVLASFLLGVAAAPRTRSDEFPLLDFPFLYPRFAALYSVAVPRAKLALEGRIAGSWFFGVEALSYLLFLDELEGPAYAFEPALQGEYRLSDHVALELGVRGSIARYPVGTRFHYLPHFDVKLGF